MATTVKEKHVYTDNDDAIILDCIEKNPDNLTQGFKDAAQRINNKSGDGSVTWNQVSSRYYSYVKPHYIEGNEEPPTLGNSVEEVMKNVGEKSDHLELMERMSKKLHPEEKKSLIISLYESLE